MKRRTLVTFTLLMVGCGTAVMDVAAPTTSEDQDLAEATQLLDVRLKEEFGPDARIQFSKGGDKAILGVALEAAPQDSDNIPAVALATFDRASGKLAVLSKDASWREATLVPQGALLLSAEGELKLQAADGTTRTVTSKVRGDLTPAPGDRLALTLQGPTREDGETAIALADLAGNVTVLADGAGVDDRPTVSPDGKTVVFVSGRTGIASLYRTNLEGAEPVQLTNASIVAGLERSGDADPEGFVPPPVNAARISWVDADTVRYDAGAGEYWRVNVRSGAATREGGAR